MGRMKETIGYALEKKTILCNGPRTGATGTNVLTLDNGTAFIDQSQTATTFVYPVSGLHVGDRINRIRIVGGIGAASGNASTVDADLRRVVGIAGGVTDASLSANITQVSVTADTALNSESATDIDHAVATAYGYYVLVTITTAANAANDVSIVGVEIDVNDKRP